MYADSHCHINDPAFDEDRSETIERIVDSGATYILNVGYDLNTSRIAVDLAEENSFMFAAVGIHPHNASAVNDVAIDELGSLGAHPKVVAIGETGLDYYRNRSPRADQRNGFLRQMELASELNKPVIIHCRDAMADCLDTLKQSDIRATGGVMHCFAGTPDDVHECVELGMYISFAGNITYPKATGLRKSLQSTPGHRLLVETDSPYLAPQKKRGKRNDPSNMEFIIDKVAEVRGVERLDIERISVTNFESLFLHGDHGEGEVAYKIRNSLYLNVTKECSNECYFCAKFYTDSVQGHNLRIHTDPTVDEMVEAVGDPTRFDEVVFCGFGEPTLRLDRVLETAKTIKAKGGRTRLNSNGHGSHIAGRDITPELVGLIDEISVSLNAPDAKTYDEICCPLIPNAFTTTIDFIKSAKRSGLDVTATVVAIPDKVDVEACRALAEDELGVRFRVRGYNLVG